MEDKSKVQTQFRLVLGKEGMDALDEAVRFVNDGFEAGKVEKGDLATYLFKHASRLIGKAELIRIRNLFFDEKLALENLIRKSETSGKLPEEIRKLLRDQFRTSPEERSKDPAQG